MSLLFLVQSISEDTFSANIASQSLLEDTILCWTRYGENVSEFTWSLEATYNLSVLFLQIVICHNTSTNEGFVEAVLVHELIHMFDYCTREMDFKNVDHVACSEVRAANMTYCSYLSAFWGKHIDRSKIQNQQKVSISE